MKNKTFLILAFACLAAASCLSETEAPCTPEVPAGDDILMTKLTGNPSANHMKGNLLVFLDEETTQRIESEGIGTVASELFSEVEAYDFRPALRSFPKNMELARELGLHRWFSVSFDDDIPTYTFAAAVARRPEVCALQFNSHPKLASDLKAVPFSVTPGLSAAAKGEGILFNDPLNENQWGLVNTGDKSIAKTAREGADVGVKDAWALTAGTPDVVVAVCDAPVKYTHPDLADNMWINEAEKNGAAGVDDDGNGYVDDIHGYNFYSDGPIKWDAEGESGHGTHVAGIIAAVNGNGIGVSSIAGGSGNGDGVRLMSCQLFEGYNAGADREMAEAFIYAADNGACIAQCSYGYPANIFSSDDQYTSTLPLEYSALRYFTDPENCNHPSIGSNLVIYAAGNEAAANSDYPGALPLCVSVTALGPDYLPAGYTNYGRGCNIAAPGGDFWIGEDVSGDHNKCMILSTSISEAVGDYAWMEGSSQACPHVSGVAALGISYAGKLGKKFTGDQFRDILLTSVNDINYLLTDGVKPYGEYTFGLRTYHNRMGTGAIDAWKLLMQIEGTPSVMVKAGQMCSVDISEYFGESAKDLTYLDIDVSTEARKALGLASAPMIEGGALKIYCTKSASAKITVSAIAGGSQLGGGDKTGGTEIKREISIVSRGVYSTNGGWL
ncbi:MAG: S8 family serine peptidase [Bacteroidales bacterium]|nr:S8 family serine peptidase [Bacteroidales bacterium]